MFARYVTVHGEPARLDGTVDHLDGEGRAAVEAIRGNRGFAVLTDPARGRLIGASYWDSAASLRDSERAVAATRSAAVAALGAGEPTVETYEVIVGLRRTIPGRGAVARLTRCEIDPGRAEEVDAMVQEEVVPRVKGATGLCSFQMLRNGDTGAGLLVAAWEDAGTSEAFAPIAEQLRARASDRVGVRFQPPETWSIIRTTVHLD
jgi:quinol monooxygenase YgiN